MNRIILIIKAVLASVKVLFSRTSTWCFLCSGFIGFASNVKPMTEPKLAEWVDIGITMLGLVLSHLEHSNALKTPLDNQQ